MSETNYVTRLKPEQSVEIAKTQQLREAARALREKVSHGSYGDDELQEFWRLADTAGVTLRESNPQLAERAGLGDKFFSTVAKERRRPKLPNFLKALIAIEEVASERLADIDQVVRPPLLRAAPTMLAIQHDAAHLVVLATSLRRIALQEIERLENERPNDPEAIRQNAGQIDVLRLLADGLARIAKALSKLSANPDDQTALTTAQNAVHALGDAVEQWWKRNSQEAVDWSIRIPVIAGGIALLGVAGAEMTLATAAVAGVVGGSKAIEAIKAAKSSAD